MQRLASLIALAIALVPSIALADRTINDYGVTATIDCAKDPEVSINGAGGTITLTGKCKKISISGGTNTVKIESASHLSVSGADNTVDVGEAEKISVSGASNRVSYKSGLGGKGKPKVSSPGVGNKITQTK
jgi:hypothetical protein